MSIKYLKGDLATLNVQNKKAIVIQIANTQGRLNHSANLITNISKNSRYKDQIEQEHAAFCKNKKQGDLIGHTQTTKLGPNFYVCNIIAQNAVKGSINYTLFYRALEKIIAHSVNSGLHIYISSILGDFKQRDYICKRIEKLAAKYPDVKISKVQPGKPGQKLTIWKWQVKDEPDKWRIKGDSRVMLTMPA